MKPFLEFVAEEIIHSGTNQSDTAVILPNKRSIVFLKEIIKKKSTESLWLPEFFSLDTFFQEASGFSKIESLQLQLYLFDIHKKIAGSEHRPMEDFLSWAAIIAFDFNDIDLTLSDATQLFDHLSANKAMQEWNLDGRPLTEMQTKYLKFYQSLTDYYNQLNTRLITEKQGYTGLIYRYLAEHFDSLLTTWKWKKFLIAGINPTSPAEMLILKKLKAHFDVKYLWDVDTYYFESKNAEKPVNSEPGRFIKTLTEELKLDNTEITDSLLSNDTKEVNLIEVQGETAQCKYASSWISNLLSNPEKRPENLKNIAIVMANEQLLIPLLAALPVGSKDTDETLRYNITMGYPLKNSHFEYSISRWFTILQNHDKNTEPYSVFQLMAFLNSPLISSTLNAKHAGFIEKLLHPLIRNNIYSITYSELEEQANRINTVCGQEMLNWIAPCSDGNQFIDRVLQMLVSFQETIGNNNEAQPIEKLQAAKVFTSLNSVRRIAWDDNKKISLKAAEKIMIQFIRQTQLNLVGEPLEGIQVMGLLETRALDFENILVLGVNEGFLPANIHTDTFIPFDIRHRFKLPLPKDGHDITAYHFYRLLQRAKNVTYVFNTSTSGLGTNDPSRFLLQLEMELAVHNPNISIHKQQLQLKAELPDLSQPITVVKTPEMIEQIKNIGQKGFSASALTTFINCKLRYYLRYLLKLKTDETIEQSMENNTFGTIIHGALENLYKPFVGQKIEPDELEKRTRLIDDILTTEYKRHFSGNQALRGKNLLLMEVLKKMIDKTISIDAINLKHEPRVLLGVENKLTSEVITKHGQMILEGTIDRIDTGEIDPVIRIVDYKSGSVEIKDLTIENLSLITSQPEKSKAFQLMHYALVYQSNYPNQRITAGNISLRKLSNGFMEPKFTDGSTVQDNLEAFKETVIALIEEVLNEEVPFAQTENIELCTYCDYRNICNRIQTG